MAGRSAHPDRMLFDYLSGSLDEQAARSVESHLSGCAACATVAEIVRELKSEISNLKFEVSDAHPDTGELANFFYSKSGRKRSPAVAAHVAACGDCATELATYARAERAAAEYAPVAATEGVPAAAWEMIRDWEESCFAKPRPASETLSNEMLTRLLGLLSEQQEQVRHSVSGRPDLVPVIVVDRSGRFRSVEVFEKATDARGVSLLKYTEESRRFDDKPVHALLDFGDRECVVLTDRVESNTIRLQRVARPDARLRQAHYFIIED